MIPSQKSESVVREIGELRDAIADIMNSGNPLTFMEVCGTHTMEIHRNGIPSLLPRSVNLLSGPGCPVCVTPVGYVDHAIELARLDRVILATFGDLIRVPGSYASLEQERAEGASVEVVYSPLEALQLARNNPEKEIVFLGVGFETTAPVTAASLAQAEKDNIKNYSILSAHKIIPPAMKALAGVEGLNVDGFCCPGHVSAIIGSKPYEFLAREHKIPCVVAGFEPLDIMQSILMLILMCRRNEANVEIQYSRVVRREGNARAREVMSMVYTAEDSEWRGLGSIPGSGLGVSDDYADWDAKRKFKVETPEPREPEGCICGAILCGIKTPPDCPLFGETCNPGRPVGACMVSSEGTCAAHFKYRNVAVSGDRLSNKKPAM